MPAQVCLNRFRMSQMYHKGLLAFTWEQAIHKDARWLLVHPTAEPANTCRIVPGSMGCRRGCSAEENTLNTAVVIREIHSVCLEAIATLFSTAQTTSYDYMHEH